MGLDALGMLFVLLIVEEHTLLVGVVAPADPRLPLTPTPGR